MQTGQREGRGRFQAQVVGDKSGLAYLVLSRCVFVKLAVIHDHWGPRRQIGYFEQHVSIERVLKLRLARPALRVQVPATEMPPK